jgi:hypothetical protein
MAKRKVSKHKGPVRPPDERPWKQPQGLGQLVSGDLVAVRFPDHWKVALSWKLRGAHLDVTLPSGSILCVDSSRQIMYLKGEIARSWKVDNGVVDNQGVPTRARS